MLQSVAEYTHDFNFLALGVPSLSAQPLVLFLPEDDVGSLSTWRSSGFIFSAKWCAHSASSTS